MLQHRCSPKPKIMDYAIYKTTNGKHLRIVHRFFQEKCNHRAKIQARTKLQMMWLRALQQQSNSRFEAASKDEFSYVHQTSENTHDHLRFYIGELKP